MEYTWHAPCIQERNQYNPPKSPTIDRTSQAILRSIPDSVVIHLGGMFVMLYGEHILSV